MSAIVFDFDGLIVDTETPAFKAWSGIFKRYNVSLELSDWVQVVGSTYSRFHPVDHLNSLTNQIHDREALMAEKEKIKAEVCDNQPVMPGVRELLSKAQKMGLKVGLASTSNRSWVDHHLRRVGLFDLFPCKVTREDVQNVKPDPEPYLKIADALGVAAKDCLVFEDSLNGVTAAIASGARCIAVPNPITKVLDFKKADAVCDSLLDVDLDDWFGQ